MRKQQIIAFNERYTKLINMIYWIMEADNHLFYTSNDDVDIEAGTPDRWQPSEHAQTLCKPLFAELYKALGNGETDTDFEGNVYHYQSSGIILPGELNALKEAATNGIRPLVTEMAIRNLRNAIEFRLEMLGR